MSGELTENEVESILKAGEERGKFQEVMENGDTKIFLVKKGYEVEHFSTGYDRPKRKKGVRSFNDLKSFSSYVNKHKIEDETIIIADEHKADVKAVFNDNGKEPAWGDFGAVFKIGFSKQWQTWFCNSHSQRNHLFDQSEFSDFLEDNRSDLMCGNFEDRDGNSVENISYLEMTNIIQNLNVTKEEKFASKVDPVSGTVSMMYENEESGKGSIKIPREFWLVVPVFLSGDLWRIKIRLRHRINGGSAKFYYIIDQVEDVKEKAFSSICDMIENGNAGSEEDKKKLFSGTGIEVYKGTF